jgi:uncharacterized protein YkwD
MDSVMAAETESVTWTLSEGKLEEVEVLFTKARNKEGLPSFSFPHKNRWEKMSDADKMFFMINSERQARGLKPLRGISQTVNQKAQEYADELLRHGILSHRVNGQNSWMRLQSDSEIARCMNRIDFAENLAWFGSQSGYQSFYMERALFSWMYDDAEHDWRHRQMLLYNGFSTSEAESYANALIGVGMAYGSTSNYRYAIYIVLNYVDPCSSWNLN